MDELNSDETWMLCWLWAIYLRFKYGWTELRRNVNAWLAAVGETANQGCEWNVVELRERIARWIEFGGWPSVRLFCRYTLCTSGPAVAALVCALYPKFPISSTDNRWAGPVHGNRHRGITPFCCAVTLILTERSLHKMTNTRAVLIARIHGC